MKAKFEAMYLDYMNNFLTMEAFAEHYGMTVGRAAKVVQVGWKLIHGDPMEVQCSLTTDEKRQYNNSTDVLIVLWDTANIVLPARVLIRDAEGHHEVDIAWVVDETHSIADN